MADQTTNKEWSALINNAIELVNKTPDRPTIKIPAPGTHEFAQTIDHTLLRLDATPAQIDALCEEAKAAGFATVCVRPNYTQQAVSSVRGTTSRVAVVVGFHTGEDAQSEKLAETRYAVQNGARELDVVLNRTHLKAAKYDVIFRELKAIRIEAGPTILLKLILETSQLSDTEIVAAALLARSAAFDFIKTSTGFLGHGATVQHVKLMSICCDVFNQDLPGMPHGLPSMQVKASGGVRSLADAVKMLRAGATRLGTSAGVAIVREATEGASAKNAISTEYVRPHSHYMRHERADAGANRETRGHSRANASDSKIYEAVYSHAAGRSRLRRSMRAEDTEYDRNEPPHSSRSAVFPSWHKSAGQQPDTPLSLQFAYHSRNESSDSSPAQISPFIEGHLPSSPSSATWSLKPGPLNVEHRIEPPRPKPAPIHVTKAVRWNDAPASAPISKFNPYQSPTGYPAVASSPWTREHVRTASVPNTPLMTVKHDREQHTSLASDDRGHTYPRSPRHRRNMTEDTSRMSQNHQEIQIGYRPYQRHAVPSEISPALSPLRLSPPGSMTHLIPSDVSDAQSPSLVPSESPDISPEQDDRDQYVLAQNDPVSRYQVDSIDGLYNSADSKDSRANKALHGTETSKQLDSPDTPISNTFLALGRRSSWCRTDRTMTSRYSDHAYPGRGGTEIAPEEIIDSNLSDDEIPPPPPLKDHYPITQPRISKHSRAFSQPVAAFQNHHSMMPQEPRATAPSRDARMSSAIAKGVTPQPSNAKNVRQYQHEQCDAYLQQTSARPRRQMPTNRPLPLQEIAQHASPRQNQQPQGPPRHVRRAGGPSMPGPSRPHYPYRDENVVKLVQIRGKHGAGKATPQSVVS